VFLRKPPSHPGFFGDVTLIVPPTAMVRTSMMVGIADVWLS
jgi:hypothetical protein